MFIKYNEMFNMILNLNFPQFLTNGLIIQEIKNNQVMKRQYRKCNILLHSLYNQNFI